MNRFFSSTIQNRDMVHIKSRLVWPIAKINNIFDILIMCSILINRECGHTTQHFVYIYLYFAKLYYAFQLISFCPILFATLLVERIKPKIVQVTKKKEHIQRLANIAHIVVYVIETYE